jgi:hypothetical protein
MAQPTNTFDSYDAKGIREDLSDTIYDISPEETPFYSGMAKVKASNTLHEWQTDALRSSAANAHIEGDDTAAEARSATTRLGNYTQIFKNAVVIPGTDDGLNKAGRAKDMAYQVLKIAKEQKLDIEKAMFANNARVAGNATTARELAGVPAWLTTNVLFGANEGASATGDGTNARTDETTALIDFSQARFDTVMESIWSAGGKPDTVMLSSYQMNIALGFTGNNNQRANIDSTKDEVRNAMAIYVTPWGTVKWQMTRENRSRDIFINQSDMWCAGVLRATKNTQLAKSGDNEKRQVITELTLSCKNEAANGALFDNAIS